MRKIIEADNYHEFYLIRDILNSHGNYNKKVHYMELCYVERTYYAVFYTGRTPSKRDQVELIRPYLDTNDDNQIYKILGYK